MVRKIGLAIFGIVTAVGLSAPAVAGELIRIETTPTYGATVTVEQGVRIFRPLPAPSRIIINPAGKTPLSMSFIDVQASYDGHAGHQPHAGGHDADGLPVGLPLGLRRGRFRTHQRRRVAGDMGVRRRLPMIRKGMTAGR